MDGNDLYPPKPVVIDRVNPGPSSAQEIPNDAEVSFDELLLERKAQLEISLTSINLGRILGDASGFLDVQADQEFFIEFRSHESVRSSPPANFILREGGTAFVCQDFRVVGTHDPAIDFQGNLHGPFNLTLDTGRHVSITDTATNAVLRSGQYSTSPEGTMTWSHLSLHDEATYTYSTHLRLTTVDIMMRFHSLIQAETVDIVTRDFHLQGGATVDVDARGPDAEAGECSGSTDDSGYGRGGCHGGYGGQAVTYGDWNYVGTPYGSYITPTHPGSGGGTGSGGSGGSTVKIQVDNNFHVDGLITANGGDSSGGNGGGGSAGSVKIDTLLFSGHGFVSAIGGSGNGYGYGGAGGRVALNCDWTREYSGDFWAYGGMGGDTNSNDGANGAAGTVWIIDNPRGPAFARYVNNTQGEEVRVNENELLFLDNDDRQHQLPTVIMSENDDYFEMLEVEARNHVVLQMHGDHDTMIAHKFSGDKTGQFHLREEQRLYVEYLDGEATYSIAPISYLTENGSELVMPTEVEFLGTRTVIHGLMVGLENFTLASGAEVCDFLKKIFKYLLKVFELPYRQETN